VRWSQKAETEPWQLSFGHAVYNGSAGQWRELVVTPHCGDLDSGGGE
jgi:hypothetical protein